MMDIKQIKQSVNILDVAFPYCGGFIKSGNTYQAKINPLRQEKTSSLFFYTDTQTYHDYGTGEHGDVIDFSRKILGLPMKEVLQGLSGVGMFQPVVTEFRPAMNKVPSDFSSLFSRFQELTLKEVSHRQELEALCPLWLLQEADQESVALFRQRLRYDPANNTVVFAIQNEHGQIVGAKRRRFQLGDDLKKWCAIKGSEAMHCHVRVNAGNEPIFILEGVKDGFNGLLLGLNFIALPSAHYKAFNQNELDLLSGRDLVMVADVDSVGIECMERLAEQIDSHVGSYFILDVRKFLAGFYGEVVHFDPQEKVDFADAVRLHAEIGGKPLYCSHITCFKAQLFYYINYRQQGEN
jgi:DNA primase